MDGDSKTIVDAALAGSQEEDLRQQRATILKSVHDVASGIDNGVSLHHRLSNEKVAVSKEEQKIGHLRKKKAGIRKAHDVAARKLRSVLMPRITLSERRLEKKRASVVKRKQEVQHWEEMHAAAHAKALQASTEKTEQAKILAQAQEEVQRAIKLEKAAKEKYSKVDAQAAREVEALQFVDTKLTASKSLAAQEMRQEEEIEASLQKARATLSREQLQFDEELVRTEDKLEKKIDHAELQKEQVERQLFATKDEFLAWQAAQKEKAREVAAMKSDYEARQKAVFENEKRGYLTASSLDKSMDRATSVDPGAQEDWAWSA